MLTVADTLRAAKAALLTRGWCQGEGDNTEDEDCLGTAIYVVPNGDWIKAQELIAHLLGNTNKHTVLSSIWKWNDAPERTFEDVLALLDQAIAYAKAHEADVVMERHT